VSVSFEENLSIFRLLDNVTKINDEINNNGKHKKRGKEISGDHINYAIVDPNFDSNKF
jgi:hypothetical protein